VTSSEEMNTVSLILDAVLIVAAAFGTAMLPRYWRGDFPAFDRPQGWWAFGDESWRAFRRTYALCVVAAWLIAIGTVLLPYVPRRPPESLPFAIPFGAALLIVFVLMNTVWYWNWPKVVVPPRLRQEHGSLSGIEWNVFRRDGGRGKAGGRRRRDQT
jgi:hypothetical protein